MSRQYLFAILGVFAAVTLEHFPRWHAHDACRDAVSLELFVSTKAESDFAPSGQQQHFGLSIFGVREHVGAAGDPVGGSVPGPVKNRQRLSRENQCDRLVAILHNETPHFGDLVRIGWT